MIVVSDPSSILKSYGGKASKRFGQNFLKSDAVVTRIVRAVQPLAGETVLEIGPGLGVLTRALLAEPIAKLVCLEIDPRCVEYLKATIDDPKLQLVQADALQVSEEELLDVGVGVDFGKFIVVANLPYNIGSPLLVKWLGKATIFKRLVLMFQKEVAERISAKPHTKQYGSLSVLAQAFCETKILFDVPANAFFPQPKITSSVIFLTPRPNAAECLVLYPSLKKICSAAFSKRRKTLRNALTGLFDGVEATLALLGLDPNKRPENLTVEEFMQLAAEYTRHN